MTWTADQPIVSLRDVYKQFDSVEVLKGISMNITKSEVVCIIGPSGSGKSTLLRCINALLPVTSGSIKVKGREVNDSKLNKLELRKTVGMVFQQYNLFPHKTAIQNVMMAPIQVLGHDKQEVRQRAYNLIEKVGLKGKEEFYPGELSGGQQQRVAIARSMAMMPEIILFDEVTAALDPEMKKEVLLTVRELAEEGMTCVLVSHEMGFTKELADNVYFTDAGIFVEYGPPDQLFNDPQDPRTRAFLSQIL